MKALAIYKHITAILSLCELLCSVLEIIVPHRDNYSLISCVTEIRPTQQRLMLR
jgi:hypothetical protein